MNGITLKRCATLGFGLGLGLLVTGCATQAEQSAWSAWDQALTTTYGETAEPEQNRALPPAEPLTEGAALDDLLAYADRENPGLRARFMDWQATLQGVPARRGLPDPQLGYAYFVSPVETRTGPQRQKVSLSQTLPWFGKTGIRGDMEVDRARAQESAYDAERLRVHFRIRSLWYELHYLGRSKEITRANRDLLTQLESVARSRYASGKIGQDPMIRAQLELGKLEDRLRSIVDRRSSLTAQINAELGRSALAPVPVPTGIEEIPLPPEAELPALLARNPELAGFEYLAQRQERAGQLAGKTGLPDLTLGAELIDIGEALDSGTPDSGKNAFLVKGSINLPLWRGQYDADADMATTRRLAIEDRSRDRLYELEAELETALFGIRDAARRIELYETTLLPKARQSLQSLERSFASGSAAFLDLVDTQRTLLEFELQLERARTDRLIQQAKTLQLVGNETPGDGRAKS